jgi:hypothetical protein
MSVEEMNMMRLATTAPAHSSHVPLLKWMHKVLSDKKHVDPGCLYIDEDNADWVQVAVWISVNLYTIVHCYRFARVIEYRLAESDPPAVGCVYGTDCRVCLRHLVDGPKYTTLNTAMTNLEVYEKVAQQYAWSASSGMWITGNRKLLPFTGFFADFDPEDGMNLHVMLL